MLQEVTCFRNQGSPGKEIIAGGAGALHNKMRDMVYGALQIKSLSGRDIQRTIYF